MTYTCCNSRTYDDKFKTTISLSHNCPSCDNVECLPFNKQNSSKTDFRKGIICPSIKFDSATLKVGNKDINLQNQQNELTNVYFVQDSNAAVPVHTGFTYNSPFLTTLLTSFSTTSITLDISKAQLRFNDIVDNRFSINWYQANHHAGRSIKITNINGTELEHHQKFLIDTGNDSFLTYDSTLIDIFKNDDISKELSFEIENKIKITFPANIRHNTTISPPILNKHDTMLDESYPYSHNVLALGFLSNFILNFNDSTRLIKIVSVNPNIIIENIN